MQISHKLHDKQSYSSSYLTQFRYVLWRDWLSIIRDPILAKLRFSLTIIVAIFYGLVYLQLNRDESAVQNVGGALAFALTQQSIFHMMCTLQNITAEMPVFRQEHRSHLYTTPVYVIAKSLADVISMHIKRVSVMRQCTLILSF
ncbi:protein white-like [Corticium candelabrum]|uniref:protein white-like n=1 Tax=Corticium candelabrum TaxID=121492 RepID=UPI002E257247|nr:protein white-like [Corticium candelabrum]